MIHKILNDFPAIRSIAYKRTTMILIFSSVLRFIEEQVDAVPDHLETGGLLLGAALDNGRLITHATPAGPKAIHQEGMFQKDLKFSQKILNHLAKKTGVDYAGEWHKHPSFLKRPSSGDRQTAAEILHDPDYQTKGILVFPIWIKERIDTSSALHEKLIEHYLGPMHTIKCYPYYMDETFQFYPFEFQVAKCDFGTQSDVVSFYNHYIRSEEDRSVNHRGCSLQGVPSQVCNTKVYPTRTERMNLDTSIKQDGSVTSGVRDSSHLWHETQVGRKKLAMEIEYLKKSSCYRGVRRLGDGRLLFRLSSPIIDHVFLDVLCKNDHSDSFPDLFLRYKKQCRHINDVLDEGMKPTNDNPLEKRIIDLNKTWKEQETARWICNISNSLGFN